MYTIRADVKPTRVALAVSAALTFGLPLVAPAAPFTVSATYNLGTSSSAGATDAPQTSCGVGNDALLFTGAGANSIGIHTYGCGLQQFQFGSRSSGEGTYFVDGHVQFSGTVTGDTFSFSVSPGHTGAWGNAFSSGEFQQASMHLLLTIGGATYFDEAFSVSVNDSGTTFDHTGTAQLLGNAGAVSFVLGPASYDWIVDGRDYTLDNLTDGAAVQYDIWTEASGNLSSTSSCLAPVSSGGGGYEVALTAVEGGQDTFNVYCGAGAQTGDPLPPFPRAVPEPASGALVAIGALAMSLAGLRRRKTRKYN